jgi:hypothetical protein
MKQQMTSYARLRWLYNLHAAEGWPRYPPNDVAIAEARANAVHSFFALLWAGFVYCNIHISLQLASCLEMTFCWWGRHNHAPLIDYYIDITGIGARYLMQEAQLWFDCRMYCGAGFNGSYPPRCSDNCLPCRLTCHAIQSQSGTSNKSMYLSAKHERWVASKRSYDGDAVSPATHFLVSVTACFQTLESRLSVGSAYTWATYLAYVRVFTHFHLARFQIFTATSGPKGWSKETYIPWFQLAVTTPRSLQPNRPWVHVTARRYDPIFGPILDWTTRQCVRKADVGEWSSIFIVFRTTIYLGARKLDRCILVIISMSYLLCFVSIFFLHPLKPEGNILSLISMHACYK